MAEPAPEGAGGGGNIDLLVIEKCITMFKTAQTKAAMLEVATILMNLKKTSTTLGPAHIDLVHDLLNRAISRAEQLSGGSAGAKEAAPPENLLTKPWAACTDEQKERKKKLLAQRASKQSGALGSGLGARGSGWGGLSEEQRQQRMAQLAKAGQVHAHRPGGGGGGSGGKPPPLSGTAGAGLTKTASKDRRERMGRAFGFGGGGGRHAAALASKKQAAAAAAAGPAPAVSDYYRLLIQQADRAAQIVADCKARRCLFVDKLFPSEPKSLWGPTGRPKASCPAVVSWRRPTQLAARYSCSPELFLDGADPGDVQQGSLGNCWFLGALTILATKDAALHRLVVISDFSVGLHQFLFFRNRTWVPVVIDDTLPTAAGDRLVFGRCKNPGEFWVPLLEKAYAKLGGCYASMEGGHEGDALVDLTGGVSKILALHESRQASSERDKVWRLLLSYQQRGYLMGTASNGEEPAVAAAAPQMGLVLNHAYGLLNVAEVPLIGAGGGIVRLLHLRNPWGETEWKGKWSSGAPQWGSIGLADRTALGYSTAEDGSFFMDFDSFYLFFEKLYLCKLFPKSWNVSQLTSEWLSAAGTAGGCSNHPTWVNNPQFQLDVAAATPVFIVLNQSDNFSRGGRATTAAATAGGKADYASIGLSLYKAGQPGRRLLKLDRSARVVATAFCNTRDRTLELTLQPSLPGQPYVLLPSLFKPGLEGKFKLSVYSEAPVSLTAVTAGSDWFSQAQPGRWTAGQAGGCRNHPSWKENPRFSLRLSGQTNLVNVRLSQQWEDEDGTGLPAPAVGFYVLATDGAETAAGGAVTVVGRTETFVAGEGVLGTFTLPAGDYQVLPCTFETSRHRPFTLAIYADGPFEMGSQQRGGD